MDNEFWSGYEMYRKGMALAACHTVREARGWLHAQYGHAVAMAAEIGGDDLVDELHEKGLLTPPPKEHDTILALLLADERRSYEEGKLPY